MSDHGGVLERTVVEAVRRVSRRDYWRWVAMVEASGCCAQPVRLSGRVWTTSDDGGSALVYTSAAEADGVLLKACGTRRATLCPACAATYRADAKHLLRAGLAIPDSPTVSRGVDADGDGPPVVFVTLTAPSFGAVHRARRPPGPCRPRRPRGGCCEHGVAVACEAVHETDDPICGAAICPDCYDCEGAVMFNARTGELWRRTTIAVSRHLANGTGIPTRQFSRAHRLEFAKVVEFQARGVVHLHILARLDRIDPSAVRIDAAALCAAFLAAAARTSAPNPLRAGQPMRWGSQIDVDAIPIERRRAAAAYLAKYATKSVDGTGLLDRRLRHADLDHLDLPDQLRRMVVTAWALGARPDLDGLHLRAWAHTLGFRGHWLTKSRHWSTTFGQLRAARQAWRVEQLGIPPDEIAARTGEWDYRGVGHRTAGDAWLAASANTARRANRRAARDAQ